MESVWVLAELYHDFNYLLPFNTREECLDFLYSMESRYVRKFFVCIEVGLEARN